MTYRHSIRQSTYVFQDLKTLLAKATPLRSGDALAGICAENQQERVAAQYALSDVPLKVFTQECVIPPEIDEVSDLILRSHDEAAFSPISSFTVGELRDWLLTEKADIQTLELISPGLTPEMVAAVSKLMRNQDLIAVSQKCQVISKFRNTLGEATTFAVRLQPNHPTDDARGILASTIDGLLYGCGDAVIGINPVTDSMEVTYSLLRLLEELINQFEIPTQSCVLCHVSTIIDLIKKKGSDAPVDLVFQSIGGTEATNRSFGVSLSMLNEAHEAAQSLQRGTIGQQLMYFETGQGSSLSADAHHGVDQQTCEARAYGLARHFNPLLVNTVVGFIGPEYLYDGKQIIRAGLEDHFCGKILGLPMGVDVCYTNHSEADQDDMDTLLTLLGVAGCNYIMGVPGADDIMLNYQSTSFHDAHYLRRVTGKKPAPEFDSWLQSMGIIDGNGHRLPIRQNHQLLGVDQ